MEKIILVLVLILVLIMFFILVIKEIYFLYKHIKSKKSKFKEMADSNKNRVIIELKNAVEELSKTKTGAIITIENHDNIENLRTDGVRIDSNISSSLLISIFNKNSPLHDGAVIIRNNKITYASTYYKITSKSINNKFGSRHRAAMGISEQSDSTTIVVSEETGGITIAKNGKFEYVLIDDFRKVLESKLKN
ncbi:diadenylate cyclase [Mesomycoplasma lagogenitalium]|uniref:DNA integrity scanning protein DisA nucleotide-binding domain protein n=1 Tax=Mesomycoplasma lagogenitalium TaxID=171286 RepID=A0ABY8LU97_9BACT|nr:DNA integrity scanning protein DisA nucleotide-binding domain protein [Mesomycoplasma lagogenitalium]WGI36812.1 DNA integrity scanning protein DisA nucleotide-binding domain protein [Mesomycoplasma lagogenitalium]